MYYSYVFKNGVKYKPITYIGGIGFFHEELNGLCDDEYMWVHTKTFLDYELPTLYLTEWFIPNLSKDNPYVDVEHTEDEQLDSYYIALDLYREVKKGIDWELANNYEESKYE